MDGYIDKPGVKDRSDFSIAILLQFTIYILELPGKGVDILLLNYSVGYIFVN